MAGDERSLEDEVTKLMDDAIKASPRILAALTGEGSLEGSVDVDVLADTILGQRRAIQRIARAIDQGRTAG